jgi:hypothetical protein
LNIDENPSSSSLTPSLHDDQLFCDAAKMLKVHIEKILLFAAEPQCITAMEAYKEQINDANYYRNILQQQHALIKHLDLSRPLTR